MRIGITGASGSIGHKLLSKCLEEGHTVTALTREESRISVKSNNLSVVAGDLSGKNRCLEKFVQEVNVLFHCASETRNEAKMNEVNVQGTKNLASCARGKVDHFVYLSSVGVYGSLARGVIDESSKEKPENLYERTKTEAEHIIKESSRDGGFRYTIMRPCKVMGVNAIDRDIYRLISYIDKGVFFYIGAAGASTNYIHVDNLIHALMLCTKAGNNQSKVYNVCDRRTMEEFIEVISRGLERKNNFIRLPILPFRIAALLFGLVPGYPLGKHRIDGLTTRVSYNISKIEKELEYRHKVSMEEGLEVLVKEWMSMNIKKPGN